MKGASVAATACAIAGACIVAAALVWFQAATTVVQGSSGDEDLAESLGTAGLGFALLGLGIAVLAWPRMRWRGVLLAVTTAAAGAAFVGWRAATALAAVGDDVDALGQFADAHEHDLAVLALRLAALTCAVLASAAALGLAWRAERFRPGAIGSAVVFLTVTTAGLVAAVAETVRPGGTLWVDIAPIVGAAVLIGGAGWNALLALALATGGEWRRVVVAAFMPLYARWTRTNVLDHDKRRGLVEALQKQPGLHARAAARDIGLGIGAAVYHLEVLERAGAVVSERTGRERRYRLAGSPAQGARVASIARQETARAILREILAQGSASQREIAKALGLRENLVAWHTARMEEADLVRRRRAGRALRVTIHESADAVLRTILR